MNETRRDLKLNPFNLQASAVSHLLRLVHLSELTEPGSEESLLLETSEGKFAFR
jgi:hypothetical protein